ncbi:amidohydrolase [Lutimonas sp.]|uniref:amidohydrolase n=1 Tax=Lutimonas sp. TaxID=1872403 RepID=UPI003D9BC73B
MDQQLKISLIQTDNSWEDIEANLLSLTQKLKETAKDVDLIVLPELFSTGFTMEADDVAESMDGKGISWMKAMAEEKQSLLIGSLLISEAGVFYNRLIVAFPDRSIRCYDKRHLFSFAGEDKVFKAGTERLVFEYKGFKICPLVCYDLRFPVWSRNTEEIDVLIYVANWPDARMQAWDTLLKARAIENLCYVLGVNRVGVDSNNLVYTGHSSVFDAMGDSLINSEPSKEGIYDTFLKTSHLAAVRDKFSFLNDRDDFQIT